jgi:hypothetical protein
MKLKFTKILMLLMFTLATSLTFAGTTYYWVGGAGTSGAPKSWNSGSNWSTSSGGAAASAVPGSSDIAIFDGVSTGPNGTNLNPFVSISSNTIALTGLQILPVSSGISNVVSFIGTATSFTISGDLTINTVKLASTLYFGQISDYGNNTISLGGNISTNTASSFTLVTCPSTNTNTAPGRIAFTGATPSITGQSGGNLGFLNLDISSTTNLSFTAGNALTINGNLNIQTGGKLTISKTLQFASTTNVNSPGTISGSGVIVGITNWSISTIGTLPSSYTTSNLQNIGTVNLDQTSVTTSTMNGMTLSRANSSITIGTANANTVTIAGSMTI